MLEVRDLHARYGETDKEALEAEKVEVVVAGRMNGVAESEADLRVHAHSVACVRLAGCDVVPVGFVSCRRTIRVRPVQATATTLPPELRPARGLTPCVIHSL